jgi:hypothetical protein
MRTPAGSECPHYYADFHRGRSQQECRLLPAGPAARRWTADLCRTCPVPRILLANGCPDLTFQASVASGLLGLGRRMRMQAFCLRSGAAVEAPEVGCGQCHLPRPAQPPPESPP